MSRRAETPIQTPEGKRISRRAYLARRARLKDGHGCVHGHYGCAAWSRGPCENEVWAAADAAGELKESE